MTINCNQLRTLIIRPVLQHLNLWSQSAEELLLGTAAQESQLGTYIHQLGTGPALGIFQMERNTYNDIWNNFLWEKVPLAHQVSDYQLSMQIGEGPDSADDMVGNLYYATAMARVFYLRVPEALPNASDVEALAAYYKLHWNTALGAATEQQFIDNYHKYVTPAS